MVFASSHRAAGVVLALIVTLAGHVATADESVGPPLTEKVAPCDPAPCESSWIIPIGRVLVMDAAQYAGLVIFWPQSFKPSAGSRGLFADNWSRPPEYRTDRTLFASDGDPAYFNAVFHGLSGSETYIAARGWGHGPMASFVFSALASFTWEYLIESWFQRPSAIDLFWTPVAGTLIGELRHQLFLMARDRIRGRAGRLVVMAILDPLGQLERALMGCEYLGDQ